MVALGVGWAVVGAMRVRAWNFCPAWVGVLVGVPEHHPQMRIDPSSAMVQPGL
jgi:hypothetical protein